MFRLTLQTPTLPGARLQRQGHTWQRTREPGRASERGTSFRASFTSIYSYFISSPKSLGAWYFFLPALLGYQCVILFEKGKRRDYAESKLLAGAIGPAGGGGLRAAGPGCSHPHPHSHPCCPGGNTLSACPIPGDHGAPG